MIKKLFVAITILLGGLSFTTQSAWARSGRCPQYERLLVAHGMPVSTFSRIMYRESNCKPYVVNRRSRSTGLLQIHPVNLRWLSNQFGFPVTLSWLRVPENNIRAADKLYESFGTRPWKTTR